jgi:hypothetical protein
MQTQAKVVESLMKAGIRFVYSSPYNYRRTKRLASKMGLETDWNCAISLRDDTAVGKPHRRARERRSADHLATAAGLGSDLDPGECPAVPCAVHLCAGV